MSTATYETYTHKRDTQRDATLAALDEYLDAHHDPCSDEFALHALVGLAGVDQELLRSGGDAVKLAEQRERIYELTCGRLATTPSTHIATAIDQIVTTLDAQHDPVLQQVVDTLTAIRPDITPAPTANTPSVPSISLLDYLPKTPSSKRVIQGLVVTAITTSIAVGVAPKAAAETVEPHTTPESPIDTTQTAASESAPVPMDVATFFDTVFNNNPSVATPSVSNAQSPEKVAQPSHATRVTYWKQSAHPPKGDIYHRSGRVPYAFENSPEGIAYASARGYKRIDLDIQVTKDGVPVVTHTANPLGKDRIFAGFTDTAGKLKSTRIEIKDMTFEEVSRLKHKNGYKIYSLEYMIKEAAKTDLTLFLELKTPHLLKSHLSEIAAMLNAAQVEAVIAGQTKKSGQLNALAHARKLGFWTHNITANTWSKPDTTTNDLPQTPAAEAPTTPEPSLDDNAATETTPDSSSAPVPDQAPAAVNDTTQTEQPTSMDDALNRLFDDPTDTVTDTPDSPEPSATPLAANPSAENVENNIPQTELDQAADDITKALVAGDEDKIKAEFKSAQKEFGDIGTLFITFDVVDTPPSERPSAPQTESTTDDKETKPSQGNDTQKVLNALDALGEDGVNWKNRAYVVERFVKAGYTVENGMGFAGRFVIESGTEALTPDVQQRGGGPGYGIAQWGNRGTSPRARAYDRFGYYQENGKYRYGTLRWFAEKTHQDYRTIKTQVDFVLWELDHTEKGAAQALKKADHSLEKSAIAALMYERPASWLAGGQARDKAIKDTHNHAQTIQQAYTKKVTAAQARNTPKKVATPADDKGACPTGTDEVKGITTGWTRSGEKQDLTLCAIPGTQVVESTATPHWRDAKYEGTTAAGETRIAVNYKIAREALKMAEAAQKDGVTLTATISYRSLAEQCSIVMKKHSLPADCPDWVTPVSGNWSSSVVYSNHMLGKSIDFYGSSVDWMKKHGSAFGFIDDVYRAEGWDEEHFTNKG